MFNRILPEPVTIYKYDKLITGLIPGLIVPILAIFLFYIAKFNDLTFEAYFNYIKSPGILSPILSLGIVFNLVVFYLFINRNYNRAARGVILATILYGIPIIIAKFFL
jgi:hypothetical protein